ncbi:MAG: hypothetical protein FGM52_04575 [Mycobacterium sp.]|nr:hypothetical protein [Mycobacterium sp.]
MDDRHRELGAVLSYLVGRQLRTNEIVSALGISRSAYYLARDEGRLTSADNLIRLAAGFGLNPVDLLVRYGLVDEDPVIDYADELRGAAAVRSRLTKRLGDLRPRHDAPPI